MRASVYILLLLVFILNQSNAQSIARVENRKIQSKVLNQERELLIYTPIDYDWRENECFEVIYVFDSQNRELFDYTSSIVSFLSDNSKHFIVVGITSPFNKELDYARNNDLLPVLQSEDSKSRFGKYSGNADNFLQFVVDEVIPYVNTNYRTVEQRIAVGHSLSASFLLYSLVKKPNLFSSYMAISPNLAYDNELLAKSLIEFDYSQINDLTYLYLSNANEGIDYWHEWKPATEKVYSFFKDVLKNEKFAVHIGSFPANGHWNTFPPSLNNAFEYYFNTIAGKQGTQLSSTMKEVSIKIITPNENDTVYIVGNQANLGDWNPSSVMMKRISKYEREIVLQLKSPAQFKFTKGSWESELRIIGAYNNITIKPELKSEYTFTIVNDSNEE